MENWLGIGPGASGTLFDDENGCAVRRTVPADIDSFLQGNAEPETEYLNRSDLIKEMILMGFRFIEGPDDTLIQKRFGKTIDTLIPETLDRWRQKGFLRKHKAALTKEGLLFLNSFVRDAFVELDKNGGSG